MMTALNDEQRTVIKKLSSVSLIPLSSSHAVSVCICEREEELLSSDCVDVLACNARALCMCVLMCVCVAYIQNLGL